MNYVSETLHTWKHFTHFSLIRNSESIYKYHTHHIEHKELSKREMLNISIMRSVYKHIALLIQLWPPLATQTGAQHLRVKPAVCSNNRDPSTLILYTSFMPPLMDRNSFLQIRLNSSNLQISQLRCRFSKWVTKGRGTLLAADPHPRPSRRQSNQWYRRASEINKYGWIPLCFWRVRRGEVHVGLKPAFLGH